MAAPPGGRPGMVMMPGGPPGSAMYRGPMHRPMPYGGPGMRPAPMMNVAMPGPGGAPGSRILIPQGPGMVSPNLVSPSHGMMHQASHGHMAMTPGAMSHHQTASHLHHPLHPGLASTSMPSFKHYNRKKFSRDYIKKCVAETIGVSSISPEACDFLVDSLSHKLKTILQTSTKYARHSMTTRMTTEHVNSAIKLHDGRKCYGYKKLGNEYTLKTHEKGSVKIDLAESAYPKFRYIEQKHRQQPGIHILEDGEIVLDDFLQEAAKEVKIPLDVSLKTHWLVVDGVQPAIPENPIPKPATPFPHTLPLANCKLKLPMDTHNTAIVLHKSDILEQGVKPVVRHDLSLEQQLFFQKVTTSIIGSQVTKKGTAEIQAIRDEALQSLRCETGLEQLLPRFCSFFHEGIKANVAIATGKQLPLLVYLVRMIDALHKNPNVSIARYLHEILPGLLTCCISNRISGSEDQYRLRKFTAATIADIVNTYTTCVNTLQSKIVSICKTTMSSATSQMNSIFGAILILINIGSDAVLVNLHLLKPVFKKTQVTLERSAKLQALAIARSASSNGSVENSQNVQNPTEKAEHKTAEVLNDTLFGGIADPRPSHTPARRDDQNELLHSIITLNCDQKLAPVVGTTVSDFEEFFGTVLGNFFHERIYRTNEMTDGYGDFSLGGAINLA